MVQPIAPVHFCITATVAFAVALLLLGPTIQYAQAGLITHAVYFVVLLAGCLSLALAAVSRIKRDGLSR